jgi:hypothetical protein
VPAAGKPEVFGYPGNELRAGAVGVDKPHFVVGAVDDDKPAINRKNIGDELLAGCELLTTGNIA